MKLQGYYRIIFVLKITLTHKELKGLLRVVNPNMIA